jgi:cyclic beta-1,2-glucan synthetase
MDVQVGQPPQGKRSSTGQQLPPLVRRLLDDSAADAVWRDGAPIRSELFSVERLEVHARSLAAAQAITARPSRALSLHRRLSDNESVLLEAYTDVARAIEAGAGITPAAEWLIDNFHVVEKQIRDIRADLPPGYYRQLPKLAGGPLSGYPRVLGVAWAFVAHTDSLFDPDALRRYLRAYQEVQPLTIGELWAVAITLRIVLVENLRRIAKRVMDSRASRAQADVLSDRLLGAAGQAAESADSVLPAHASTSYPDAFLVQMVQRLRDQDPAIGPALAWLDEQLARQGITAESVVRDEHQRQVAASITVRNIITSMRLISDVDWTEFFERVSPIDDILGEDGAFGRMDFATRNLYRTAIEELSRGCSLGELDVARAAVEASRRASSAGDEPRRRDPGYYLISTGRKAFERLIRFRPRAGSWPGRAYRALGVGGYVLAGALLASLLIAGPVFALAGSGVPPGWLVALVILGAIPAIDLSVAIVNHFVTRGFRATLLPAIDFRGGVPAEHRTLVAVPTMLTSLRGIDEQVEQLEIHHLASVQGEVYFALLTDWADAPSETLDQDQLLLDAARAGIAELNQKYGPGPQGDRFYILHRRRVWSESEKRWIGWERKRGKLSELNRLLRAATNTTFIEPPVLPSGVRYVVTLDADTRLPRETLRRLIGKMAHPLNRPRFDERRGRVIEGHAILQPRVTPSLPVGREGSPFLRVFSSSNGIDPYAAAVSDVYQDLFGEGSYIGKGIYDVDAFEAALEGRVPDSTLLSHDLFEGVFARAGLVSDVEVVEEFPSRYDVASRRNHRWIRGDWQLLPWILGGGPRPPNSRSHGGVTAIGRWKMLDNLRRSLTAPTAVAALIAGFALPFELAMLWTCFIVATLALPLLIPVLMQIAAKRPGVTLRSHLRALAVDFRAGIAQLGLAVAFIGDQAWLAVDAILRTLFRLTVTRRNLLEWTPSSQVALAPQPGLGNFYRRMPGAAFSAGLAIATVVAAGGSAWPVAALFAGVWLASPAIAHWASQSPRVAGRRPLDKVDARAMRQIGRETWRFFETFVTEADNFLPPDNFQETPQPVVARRTSPTNIGLYLLAAISAHDLGWIGRVDAVERIKATLATVSRMAKHRGHLLNWYGTADLRPLDPQYVSSVDSGNFAGHLIAVANTCRLWREQHELAPQDVQGLCDEIDLLEREAGRLRSARASDNVAWRRLDAEIAHMREGLAVPDNTPLSEEALNALSDQAALLVDTVRGIALQEGGDHARDLQFWADAVRADLESRRRDLAEAGGERFAALLREIEETAMGMALGMDFAFLLNPERLLLSIGYQVAEGVLDPSCYDLLASEARLASFIAIAKRDAPSRHWFRLGRAVTPVGEGAALISWSGSMFEYLMPSIVMKAPADSLIEQTNRLIVECQIAYAKRLNAPWGVSESAYNERDLELTYQYSNFGVPGLGLKRGLADSAVIAPYATALASMIAPRAAVANFRKLEELDARGRYGFCEALDFTPSRVPAGERVAVIRAYMAHHQGMSICAIADVLLDGLMRDRFHADPLVQATELLLQERVPRDVTAKSPSVSETTSAAQTREVDSSGAWRKVSPHSASPATQLLSNGRYSVMLTAAGSGYSTWRNMAVTRWREDSTCDGWGSYVFLRDVATSRVWSAGYQPVGITPDAYNVAFNEDKAEYSRRDGTLTTSLQVLVSAEDDAEVRRITISNIGDKAREIEVTSYAELVLAPQASDQAHQAFSKLFVETEYLQGLGAILATRRRRSRDEREIWAANLAVIEGDNTSKREFETDRARFIGRGGDIRAPAAVFSGRPLSGTTGTVLDPVFALRRRVHIEPGATVRIDFWTMIADTRDGVLDLIDKHHDTGAFQRAAALAWTQAQVQLHHLGINRAQAGLYQRLAGHIVYASPTLRASSDIINTGSGGQPTLWSMGISGDLPIMLVRISDVSELGLVREALQAVEYLRMKRLIVDLVIVNERATSYVQDLQIALEAMVRASQSRPQIGGERPPGHIFMLRADMIAAEARALLGSVARIVLVGERGRMVDQLEGAPEARPMARLVRPPQAHASELQIARRGPDLEYFNGFGGFSDDGREYTVVLGPGQSTPAPWINVVANEQFGFHASAEGGGYAWSVNSREHQLTPWSNDPVTDRPGQCIYLRDDETGDIWTPTALPIRDDSSTYVARHGWGYSRFENTSHGIASELIEYVPLADPVKISRITVRNVSSSNKRLSVVGYAEWVLGQSRPAAAPFVITSLDAATRAILAKNPWNPAFAERTAFLDMRGKQEQWTADRREFLGRNGSIGWPAALSRETPLSGRVGAGIDPCAAMLTEIEIKPGESREIVFLLGDASSEAEARTLIARYREADLDAILADVRAFWEQTLGTVQVKTPDRSMDIMLNGWLTYQTLAARVWARSGFYQASGAYGFRDQLQDCMSLATVRPAMTREHLLRAAGRQFVEGDVQHWWLPHSGQGVRTLISDDRAWLAYATAHYVRVTGDAGVLDEVLPFLEGDPLPPGHSDSFFQPRVSEQVATLYEHCARALDASLPVGRNGLPLMGSGDWNDGMNRVAEGGKGESVWLGWLLGAALNDFNHFADERGEHARAQTWRKHAVDLGDAQERNGWDGEWYRRAWYDDGSILGSEVNEECRIDAIAQSWAVLSRMGRPDRALKAMAAVERNLILPHDGISLLFTPPFNRTPLDPGYIKGYPPGIRENGGQYTHAALWSVMAFAALGQGDKAAALFWMINPINHARTRTDIHRYKVEPYVVAADVYSAPGHVGRGGWTWYTGSAGWMQRAGIESIIGIRVLNGVLHFAPCIPSSWPGFEASLVFGRSRYHIVLENPDHVQSGIAAADLDGTELTVRPLTIPLVDDGASHTIRVRLG